MNKEEIKKLAIECGAIAEVRSFLTDGETGFLFIQDELAAYTAAVEAPLQADIQTLKASLIALNQAWEATHKNTEEKLYSQLRIANARIAQLEEEGGTEMNISFEEMMMDLREIYEANVAAEETK